MALNDFDIGKQARLDIISNGAILDSTQVTEFQMKQETDNLTSRPLNRPPIFKELPKGWTGSFKIDRLGPVLDDYFAAAEDTYWNGGADAQIFLTQTVREKTGAISQYRYEGVAMKLDDAGAYAQDKTVTQSVSFMASRRRKVS